MNTIKYDWDEFEEKIIPKETSPIQRQEMKRSFYAGIQSILFKQIELSDLDEDAAVAELDKIHKECNEFFDGVAKGVN